MKSLTLLMFLPPKEAPYLFASRSCSRMPLPPLDRMGMSVCHPLPNSFMAIAALRAPVGILARPLATCSSVPSKFWFLSSRTGTPSNLNSSRAAFEPWLADTICLDSVPKPCASDLASMPRAFATAPHSEACLVVSPSVSCRRMVVLARSSVVECASLPAPLNARERPRVSPVMKTSSLRAIHPSHELVRVQPLAQAHAAHVLRPAL